MRWVDEGVLSVAALSQRGGAISVEKKTPPSSVSDPGVPGTLRPWREPLWTGVFLESRLTACVSGRHPEPLDRDAGIAGKGVTLERGWKPKPGVSRTKAKGES